ncbi:MULTISPECIES: heteromeric transposase endonuclease subunit TnsA [Pseudoalteromonas]|uniref:heteromeric transposase endonuclease subunit TnsA n=1 Tax=Pseudoalteromonas TaxID=53246 RepID=UPI00057C433E|nr:MULTISPECIES: heteromeric transposase endonuclease subunit TnsA [Pseudoalteromonas]KID37640.1 Tn7 transposition protein A [Pseudoalteromonas flavipulchra NCIMB 2033 = ATCC BAA-314]MBD0783834.1 heteromeric transposase endonuclease subunit TnsA [Pseudoalteromonas flavipulchra]MBE0374411.1 hypothetical protein [Pseudoalteromonas flavipulchra NCIMB 2033 = ATCC BAA-314]MCF2825724.1 heteromeric transposase endonuclease subunit TnsA [Pseudoalteromonas sp. OF5H-5]MCF2833502.1 heteromeric transposas
MARGRRLASIEDFNRSLKKKYGIGTQEAYKPWLRIQDVNSKGKKSTAFGRKIKRYHHFLSGRESEFFYIAEFSDSVIDIREQFPLLPLTLSQKVASAIGVPHPIVTGTDVPNIMTTDFLLTRQCAGDTSFHAISVKPDEKLTQRISEKLDIERVIWELLGIKFSFFTGNEITKAQAANIKWATSPFRSGAVDITQADIEIALGALSKGKYLLSQLCSELNLSLKGRGVDGLYVLRYLIAEKYIHVDLDYSIVTSNTIEILSLAQSQSGSLYGA